MNILDENVAESQRQRLRDRGLRIRQIGYDVGRKGIKDPEIIPLLHRLRRSTLFTLDAGFHRRSRCHSTYCLVYLDVDDGEIADWVRRFFRHPEFDTLAKRLGTVVRVSSAGIRRWRRSGDEEAVAW